MNYPSRAETDVKRISKRYLADRTPAPPVSRRRKGGTGRLAHPRYQQRSSVDPFQYWPGRVDRRRADAARLLSWLKRLI